MQSELNQEERRKNVKDVYMVKSTKDIQNKRILLVDDIFTTGYTADECARIMCEANAKSVGIFTIAKDWYVENFKFGTDL